MQRPNILVVVVDGLRASALGAYGNTTFPTPTLDQFAAESVLFDDCLAPTEEFDGVYHALWHSRHPARHMAGYSAGDVRRETFSLATLFSQFGYNTALVTDEPQLANAAGAQAFAEAMLLSKSSELSDVPERADDISQTQLARFFAQVADVVIAETTDVDEAGKRSARPRLVWAHTCGMYGSWDAPLDLQEPLRGDDDPPPADNLTPPDLFVTPEADPDIIFSHTCAYAAQVMVLDECWRHLTEAVTSSDFDSWLVMLIGARGFPLGEHGKIGGIYPRLYAEQLHVPWLIRLPNARARLMRTNNLTTHLDVLPTLAEFLGSDSQIPTEKFDGRSTVPLADDKPTEWRDAVLSISRNNCYALRTASWCLREICDMSQDEIQSDRPQQMASELFVRPDDRWEANDVSKLCPDVAEELRSGSLQMIQALASGASMPRLFAGTS